MSTKYPVEFMPSPNTRIDKLLLDIIKPLSAEMGLANDTPIDPMDFVFRTLRGRIGTVDPPYKGKLKVEDIYLEFRTISKELDEREKRFCRLLQMLVDAIDSKRNWERSIGALFETSVLPDAKSRFNGVAKSPANIVIQNTKFEHGGVRQLDIGIDGLDQFDELTMCECMVSLTALHFPDKVIELEFYSQAFTKVRSVVTPLTKLRFEVLAADSRGIEKLEEVIPGEIALFKRAGVTIGHKIYT